MSSNNAEVSSAALSELRKNLANLSSQIQGICDTMNSDRSRIGQDWRDSKFEEFSSGFQPQIDRCAEISERYKAWCVNVLDQAIERVELIEHADVVNGGGTSAGASATVGAAGVGAATAIAGSTRMSGKFNLGDKATTAPPSTSEATEEPWAVLGKNVDKNTSTKWKNNNDLEKAFGQKRGKPMTISEADMQKANPHYGEGDEYGVNCATAVNAYALRLQGHDVTAKGNYQHLLFTNNNDWISRADNVFKVWKNTDGSKAEPKYMAEWMKENGVNAMTGNDYRKYFEETCKEKGVYILGLKWKGGGGHATILQRDDDGLHLIEPQVYESDRTSDGRRDINDLLTHINKENGESGLSMHPGYGNGIMRVDDKLFDPKYANLFEVNK